MATVYAGAGTEAARVAGEDREMDRVAQLVANAIERRAAPHRKTGTYIGTLTVERVRGKRGVTDRMVSTDDRAGLHIEWGHATRPSATRPGPARWVPGLRIVSGALREVR